MKVVFKNVDDKQEFINLADQYEGVIKVNGVEATEDVINNLHTLEDVDVRIENEHSTIGAEFVSDLMNLGLLKEGEDVNGWIG